MLFYYSGGDGGVSFHPEVYLGGECCRMLSYHNLTPAGQSKYIARFRVLLRVRGCTSITPGPTTTSGSSRRRSSKETLES